MKPMMVGGAVDFKSKGSFWKSAPGLIETTTEKGNVDNI